jgi:microcystin-dependent protein
MAQGFQVQLPTRLFDVDGTPANGWKIETYVGGSSTPLATYSDALLTSLNTNPIITDSSGYYRCFVAETIIVKLIVKNAADVQQFTFDRLEPMPDTTGSGVSVTAVPTGGMVFYGAAAAPTGFLLCDGSLVSRATYSTLFAVTGTTYGAGDGSTTFGLPDLRGAFPLGKAAAGTGSTLGSTGGSLDHTHTGPSHTHSVTVTEDGWHSALNSPSFSGRLNVGDAAGTGTFASSYQAAADLVVTSAAGGTGNTGSANPPFVVGVWVIKT